MSAVHLKSNSMKHSPSW